ncbi:MBL fold metallo-hydrolase [Candidatus Woesearchaeota archaeon]|nr:MBL fold metallo-hydrolase [Candidatus Woesearchaeota archaeon]
MEVSVLASGSSGNSTFVSTKSKKFLFDAGLSCRRIKKKLSSIGQDIKDIDAIFVSHEHIDHIRGLRVIQKYHETPIYAEKLTHSKIGLDNINHFIIEKAMKLNGVSVKPMKTRHDAVNSCGFLIEENKKKIGIFTDLGCMTDNIKEELPEMDAIVLESNHDIDMLIDGPYPYFLKQRIMSDDGHLSNIDAGISIKENATEKLRTVFLSHLSQKNNTPDKAYETFTALINKNKALRIDTVLTDQVKPTELRRI